MNNAKLELYWFVRSRGVFFGTLVSDYLSVALPILVYFFVFTFLIDRSLIFDSSSSSLMIGLGFGCIIHRCFSETISTLPRTFGIYKNVLLNSNIAVSDLLSIHLRFYSFLFLTIWIFFILLYGLVFEFSIFFIFRNLAVMFLAFFFIKYCLIIASWIFIFKQRYKDFVSVILTFMFWFMPIAYPLEAIPESMRIIFLAISPLSIFVCFVANWGFVAENFLAITAIFTAWSLVIVSVANKLDRSIRHFSKGQL